MRNVGFWLLAIAAFIAAIISIIFIGYLLSFIPGIGSILALIYYIGEGILLLVLVISFLMQV